MKSKSDKEKQKRLEQQQAEDRALFMQAYQKANAPDPLEERRRSEALAFLDAVESKTKPFDVTQTPGMEPHLDLYRRAKAGEAEDANTDTGVFQLGNTGGSTGLIARMREQGKLRREERTAGNLSDAFAGKYAEVTGNTIPFLLRFKQQREMGSADLMSSRSGHSTSLWTSFKPEDSIWSKLFQQASRGAGQAAAMMAGGGGGG